jgi:RNA polymerase sigma-70 factor (ECF subfamily)
MVLDAVIVGQARGPALAGYAGRSDLRGWLRSVAVRVALKAWSRERAGEPIDDWEELGEVIVDPAILHLKTQYAADVAAAFREAVAALTARQRTLLRLHHLDGLTVDDLARMYDIHRATAARWVAAAREAVFEETRVRLQQRLGFDDAELVSVVRLVQSQLLQSLRRLLA